MGPLAIGMNHKFASSHRFSCDGSATKWSV